MQSPLQPGFASQRNASGIYKQEVQGNNKRNDNHGHAPGLVSSAMSPTSTSDAPRTQREKGSYSTVVVTPSSVFASGASPPEEDGLVRSGYKWTDTTIAQANRFWKMAFPIKAYSEKGANLLKRALNAQASNLQQQLAESEQKILRRDKQLQSNNDKAHDSVNDFDEISPQFDENISWPQKTYKDMLQDASKSGSNNAISNAGHTNSNVSSSGTGFDHVGESNFKPSAQQLGGRVIQILAVGNAATATTNHVQNTIGKSLSALQQQGEIGVVSHLDNELATEND
jgi:hypothetical protein